MDQFVFDLKLYALHFFGQGFPLNTLFYAFHLGRVSGPLRKCHLFIKFAIRRCRGGVGDYAAGCCRAVRPGGRSAAATRLLGGLACVPVWVTAQRRLPE